MEHFDLTFIIEFVIALIFALVARYVIPWLKKKLDAEQLENIQTWVTIFVDAAEQLYQGRGRGEEKLTYVLERLEEKGFTIDISELRAMIEAAVYDLPGILDVKYGPQN